LLTFALSPVERQVTKCSGPSKRVLNDKPSTRATDDDLAGYLRYEFMNSPPDIDQKISPNCIFLISSAA
jgi:hypothetical protein